MEPAALLRLVSETTRHGILQQLRQGERSVGDLVRALQDEQTNISHHLAVLREAGLVTRSKAGRHQLYRLADAELGRLLEQVEAIAGRVDQVAYTTSLGLPAQPAFHGYG